MLQSCLPLLELAKSNRYGPVLVLCCLGGKDCLWHSSLWPFFIHHMVGLEEIEVNPVTCVKQLKHLYWSRIHYITPTLSSNGTRIDRSLYSKYSSTEQAWSTAWVQSWNRSETFGCLQWSPAGPKAWIWSPLSCVISGLSFMGHLSSSHLVP